MVEIRQVRQEEMADAIRLADAVFRDSEQTSMAEAFPLVFSQELGQSFGAFEAGRLVAFIGIVPFRMRVGEARLGVYSLGAVCTAPEQRGRGHAGAILGRIQAFAREAGASLIFVSGGRSLYLRAGCFPHGQTRRYVLDSAAASALADKASPDLTIRELSSADWFQLHDLTDARSVRYEQSISELAAMITSKAYASCVKLEHRVLVAEQGGRLIAAAAFAVPAELAPMRPPFVVESAGDPAAEAFLYAKAVAFYGLERLEAVVPWHETGMHTALAETPFVEERNYGTVCVTDAELLMTQLAPYLAAKNERIFRGLRFRNLGEGRSLIELEGRTAVLEPAGLVSLLFDPAPVYQADEEMKKLLAELFPVPLPHIGGLNYV